MQIAFPRTGATAEEEAYNARMSALGVAVEWNYKDLKHMWSLNDFSQALKVRQSPIGLLYIASALLLKFKTCLEAGGQVQAHFKCPPPHSRRVPKCRIKLAVALRAEREVKGPGSAAGRACEPQALPGSCYRSASATGARRITPAFLQVLQTRQSS